MSDFDCKNLLTVNVSRSHSQKVILCIFYNMVWGQPLQLLDSQFGLTSSSKMQSLNLAIM